MYNEDMDLCWRAHDAGWGVGFAGTAEVTHVQGVSTARHPYRMMAGPPPLGPSLHVPDHQGLAPRRAPLGGAGARGAHGHGHPPHRRQPLARCAATGLCSSSRWWPSGSRCWRSSLAAVVTGPGEPAAVARRAAGHLRPAPAGVRLQRGDRQRRRGGEGAADRERGGRAGGRDGRRVHRRPRARTPSSSTPGRGSRPLTRGWPTGCTWRAPVRPTEFAGVGCTGTARPVSVGAWSLDGVAAVRANSSPRPRCRRWAGKASRSACSAPTSCPASARCASTSSAGALVLPGPEGAPLAQSSPVHRPAGPAAGCADPRGERDDGAAHGDAGRRATCRSSVAVRFAAGPRREFVVDTGSSQSVVSSGGGPRRSRCRAPTWPSVSPPCAR